MVAFNIQTQSLDRETYWIEQLLKDDKNIMKNFGIASFAIKNGKYKNNKFKQKLKLQSTKNEFIDIFLMKLLRRKEIIINIKNKIIKDFFKLDYDKIMLELDNLIIKPKCDCRIIGFGFCFC